MTPSYIFAILYCLAIFSMSNRKKLIIALLIIATVILAVLTILIALSLGKSDTVDTQTDTQIPTVLSNCDNLTNTCTVSEGVCDPARAFVHFCNDVKNDSEKCISSTPIEISGSPLSAGQSINLNDYLQNVSCGTIQLYLELENSGVKSLGACGTTVRRFATACTTTPPLSFPQSQTPQAPDDTTEPGTDNGGIQIAQPQFSIINSVTPSCESNGTALLRYRVTVTNTSTVSGTINRVTETFNTNLQSISPTTVSIGGTFSNNRITWLGSDSERTFASGQSKNYNYEIRIPINLLETFQNGINTTSTVIYDTSVSENNANSFELIGKHSCTITTTGTTPNQANGQGAAGQLPNTAATDNLTFLTIGITFIILAVIFFRFEIGKKQVEKIIKNFRN